MLDGTVAQHDAPFRRLYGYAACCVFAFCPGSSILSTMYPPLNPVGHSGAIESKRARRDGNGEGALMAGLLKCPGASSGHAADTGIYGRTADTPTELTQVQVLLSRRHDP
jgi:hypothetical protein